MVQAALRGKKMRKPKNRSLTLRTLHREIKIFRTPQLMSLLKVKAAGGADFQHAYSFSGCRLCLKLQQIDHCVIPAAATHFRSRLQASTDGRTQRRTKQLAALLRIQLNAGRIGGLAMRHTRNRRRN
jgi:hypothetical protein